MKHRIALLGPPASGKGTLADRLCADLGFITASPGSILRVERVLETELGKMADIVTSKGALLDDNTINTLVGSWLGRQTRTDIIFDGYPRTRPQGVALDRILAERSSSLDLVFLMEAESDKLRERIAKRAECGVCRTITSSESLQERCVCGGELVRRNDDTREIFENRMLEYSATTVPLVDYYVQKGILERLDAAESAELVFQAAKTIILH